MKGFIYIIKNTINNKVYIGQTRTSVNQRWSEHLRHAKYAGVTYSTFRSACIYNHIEYNSPKSIRH